MQELKMAQNRVGVLIGKGGQVKKDLEEKTGTRISIDSQEGMVRIEGESAVPFLRAVEVINAINRGFHLNGRFPSSKTKTSSSM